MSTRTPHRVYFVEGAGLIKIGTTCYLDHRVAELARNSPVPLRLVYAVPGDQELEGALHDLFYDCRRHGEWFALPRDWRDRVDAFLDEGAPWATSRSHMGRCLILMREEGGLVDFAPRGLRERYLRAAALLEEHGLVRARKILRARALAAAMGEART